MIVHSHKVIEYVKQSYWPLLIVPNIEYDSSLTKPQYYMIDIIVVYKNEVPESKRTIVDSCNIVMVHQSKQVIFCYISVYDHYIPVTIRFDCSMTLTMIVLPKNIIIIEYLRSLMFLYSLIKDDNIYDLIKTTLKKITIE